MEEHKRRMISDIKRRVKALYAIFTIVAILVFVRIGCVQFFSHDTAVNAEKLRRNIIIKDSLAAHRGSIFDRNGKPLATSIFRQSVIFDFGSEGFDNRERFLEDADSLSKLLAAHFGDRSAKDYYKKMMTERDKCFRLVNGRDSVVPNGDGFFARLIARLRGKPTVTLRIHDTVRKHSYTRLFGEIDYNEWQVLKEYPILNESLGRVYTIEKSDRRVYPQNNIALRLIGRSGQQGKYGIEYAYREELAGENGYEWLQCIAPRFYGRVDGADYKEPVDGMDVVTTLDADVQDFADKALHRQLEEKHGIWGTSIVMECSTGDIIAMVNLGRNSKGEYVENNDYALTARAEPGSTFKLASVLALVGDCHLPLSLTYDTGHGKAVQIGDGKKKVRIQDSHNIGGKIDMLTAFAQSANVYFTKAIYNAYKDNPQAYCDFLKSLHLNRPMLTERLKDVSPVMYEPKDKYHGWTPHETLINMGYGYALELAPIHTLTLYNAVANGGRMVAPRFVSALKRGEHTVEEFPTQVLVDKIADNKTLAAARQCLEEVALSGTAKEYFGEKASAFRVGAKTGTAKFAQGKIQYSDGYYLGSMVTYFPADKPRYTVMTAIFKRRGDGTTVYGAGLAGPVQQQICTFLYNRNTNWAGEIAEEGEEYRPTDVKGGDIVKIRRVASRLSQRTQSGSRSGWGQTSVGEDGTLTITPIETANNTMPDVRGMGLSDAVFMLESRGLRVSFSGSGKVVEQVPAAGVGVKRGNRVTIVLK